MLFFLWSLLTLSFSKSSKAVDVAQEAVKTLWGVFIGAVTGVLGVTNLQQHIKYDPMATNPMPKLKNRSEQVSKLHVFIDGRDGRQTRKLSYSSSTSTREIGACEVVGYSTNEIVSSNQHEFG